MGCIWTFASGRGFRISSRAPLIRVSNLAATLVSGPLMTQDSVGHDLLLLRQGSDPVLESRGAVRYGGLPYVLLN